MTESKLNAIRARVREAITLLAVLKLEIVGPERERAERAWLAADDADRLLDQVVPDVRPKGGWKP